MTSINSRIKSLVARNRYKKKVFLHLDHPVVSFTFDDAPESAFDMGGKILTESNLHGTYYVSLELIGKESPSGKICTLTNIERALSQGHEMGCHTYSHLHAFHHTSQELEKNIIRNQEVFAKTFKDFTFSNFAYPYGEITTGIKKIVKEKFMSARTSFYGINSGNTDLYCLKAVGLYEKFIGLADVEIILKKAMEKNAWLIFYIHDISQNYSEFGCSPGFFEQVINLCKEKNLTSLTITETLNKYILKNS